MNRIAVLGMREMGSRVAQNLLQANHQVVVCNRTLDKATPLLSQGGIYAANPAVKAATPVSIAVHAIYQDAIARGDGNDNITGIARRFIPLSAL